MLVLHSHIPYSRLAGNQPNSEVWIHNMICDTYIPLLLALYDLREEGVPFRLTISLTPLLCEQLANPDVLQHLPAFMKNRIALAQRDMQSFAPETITSLENIDEDQAGSSAGNAGNIEANIDLYNLARWYKTYYKTIDQAFRERFHHNIIQAFKTLQDEGLIEIAFSAATHAYLPLLSHESSIRAQIELGIQNYKHHFGREPQTMWLPEMGYRPQSAAGPGLETLLQEYGIKAFFVETHAITGGQPIGVPAGDVIGAYGQIKRYYALPMNNTIFEKRTATPFLPYYVGAVDGDAQQHPHSGVTVIGRNNDVGQQVWSAQFGYPGDFDYREFHRKSGTSSLQYWRVTGNQVDLENKDVYHPDWASYKVEQHAEHFSHLVGDLLRDYHLHTDQYGVIASSFVADLFGRWWFEGIDWLRHTLRHLSTRDDIDVTTPSAFVEQYPAEYVLRLPESSWGAGGAHFIWDNSETHWFWDIIHEAEATMQALADQHPNPDEQTRLVLNQAARALLLMQSSDWAFLITTTVDRRYGLSQFTRYAEQFSRLVASLQNQQADVAFAQYLFNHDPIFAELDFGIFRTRS